MKTNISKLFLLISVLCVSCSSGGIQPADPPITYSEYTSNEDYLDYVIEGVDLTGCLEVEDVSAVIVPGEEYSNIHNQINATVKVKMIKEPAIDVTNEIVEIHLLNEYGAELAKCYVHESLPSKSGSVVTLTGHTDEDDKNNVESMFKQVKFISLSVKTGYKEEKEIDDPEEEKEEKIAEDEESSSDTDSESDEGREDWDALLTSYEQYVDRCISYMKKAANGDMSALEEYPSLMKKAQELCDKMQNVQGQMSVSQWERYIKITNKLTKAATDVQ